MLAADAIFAGVTGEKAGGGGGGAAAGIFISILQNECSIYKVSSLNKYCCRPERPVDFARYEGNMRRAGGHEPCQDWGDHPVDCIREVRQTTVVMIIIIIVETAATGRTTTRTPHKKGK